MFSRIFKDLDERLARATHPVDWAILQAQRALYKARQGQSAEASQLIAQVRQRFADAPHAEVVAWVSLAEALNHFFSKPGAEGMDRMRRAEALARLSGSAELRALCNAWLAHFEFNANRMAIMAEHARQTLTLAGPDNHAAWSRLSLVLADALHFAGRYDLAQPWYAKCHFHAVQQGDDSVLSAFMHNRAAIATNALRLLDAFDERVEEDALRLAFMATSSTKNYDQGIGSVALKTLVPLIYAQLLTIQRDFGAAAAAYDPVLNTQHPDTLDRRLACHHADRAWCRANLGDLEGAHEDIATALAMLPSTTDVDDVAATHARLRSAFGLLGEDKISSMHAKLAAEALAEHQLAAASLLTTLDALVKDFPNSCSIPRKSSHG